MSKLYLHTEPGLLRQFPEELTCLPEPLQIKIEETIRMSP